MTKACVKTSGTSTTKGASVLFFGFHWSFTILEPSGKGWPLPGTPVLNASIMIGLATITLRTSSVRAEETTAQSSYPLKSENAIPLGDVSEYLSCASTVVPPRKASTAVAIAIVSLPLCFMDDPFLTRQKLDAPADKLEICNATDGCGRSHDGALTAARPQGIRSTHQR